MVKIWEKSVERTLVNCAAGQQFKLKIGNLKKVWKSSFTVSMTVCNWLVKLG